MSIQQDNKIIVALDNMSRDQIIEYLDKYSKNIGALKIGMELFYSYGKKNVLELYEKYKVPIFLDLKLHDIPNTIASAITSLNDLPIKYLTVHLSGGEKMLLAAMEACQDHLPKTTLLGVSYLTSLSQSDCENIWPKFDLSNSYEHMLMMAAKIKFPGLILSAGELELAKRIEHKTNHLFVKITPGIRFKEDSPGDQARVFTPKDAIAKGADALVIGRSLTKANNIEERFKVLKEL